MAIITNKGLEELNKAARDAGINVKFGRTEEELKISNKIIEFLEKHPWIDTSIDYDPQGFRKEMRERLLTDLKTDPELVVFSVMILLDKVDELRRDVELLDNIVHHGRAEDDD